MFYLLAAFCVGPIILYCYGALLPAFVYFLFSLCCVVLLRTRYFLPALFLLFGFLYTQFEVDSQKTAQLHQGLIQKEMNVAAYLCSIPVSYVRYSKAEFCLISAKEEGLSGNRVSLTWPESMSLDSKASYYKLKVRLKPTRATLNFVGSSYEQYLFYKRVVARGNIIDIVSQENEYSALSLWGEVRQKLNVYRMSLDTYLASFVRKLEHGGLIRALLIGERSLISAHDNQVLRYTGTQHLLAISGLHVGLVMFGLYRLFSRFRWNIPVVSSVGLLYVLMVGASESALRAWVMMTLALFLMTGYWKRRYLSIYMAALFAVLLLDPLSTMNIGFWYSFLCVALLLLISQMHPYLSANHSSLILVQLVLILGMAPINAMNGNVQGVSSFAGNLFAVPWVSVLVLPITLLALCVSFVGEDLGGVLFETSDIALQILIQYLSSISGLFFEFSLSSDSWILFAFFAVALGMILFVRFLLLSALFVLVLFVVLCRPVDERDERFEFVVFDAGQGLAVAMNWDGQYWLYDTGLSFGSYSLVESAVFPYFREKENLQALTGLIVSHGDADHAGGAQRVNEYLEPNKLWLGEPGRHGTLGRKVRCSESMSWGRKSGRIDVLYPFDGQKLEGLSANNRSCVIRFTYKDFVFLVMGDVEGEAEMQIVERYKQSLKADVLIAGHHGSANATSIALLKHVRPKYVVASAGYLNRFGHPHAMVAKRFEQMGAELLLTASLGALRFRIDDSALSVETARDERSSLGLER